MKEYIERSAAMESILGLTIADPAVAQYADAVCYHLQNLPTANVVEVRHGRWSSNGIALVCSECGRAFGIVEMFAHYCPWCGSRMDKEEEHEKSKPI